MVHCDGYRELLGMDHADNGASLHKAPAFVEDARQGRGESWGRCVGPPMLVFANTGTGPRCATWLPNYRKQSTALLMTQNSPLGTKRCWRTIMRFAR